MDIIYTLIDDILFWFLGNIYDIKFWHLKIVSFIFIRMSWI